MSRAEKGLLTHFWVLDVLISLAQQCCIAWDVHASEMWCRAEALGHACSLVRGEVGKKEAEGPPRTAAWSTLGMAQPCSLRRQSALHITQLALTDGSQAGEGSGFGWEDNVCCSWLSLRQVLLRSGGQVQVFQGLVPAPGLLSPHCFELFSVSAFHGRTCAAKLLSTPFFPPA